MADSGLVFLVRRDDLASTRIDSFDANAPLDAGELRCRIDHFAFTANNITYAVFGEAMHYWQFFPAPAGWGCVPVWGFATVQESRCDGLAVGERLYGYWPTASHAVLRPGPVGAKGFSDAAAHRAGLPAVYNLYQRAAFAPGYAADREGAYAVLRPLFATAWLIDDFITEAGDFGARRLLLSSASSKTAYATAFCLQRGKQRNARVVGATSPSRLEFCRSLGVYDEVIAYDDLAAQPADEPAVYIDFAGDAALRRRVHEHWSDALRHSASIGGTHHGALGSGADLPGPRPLLFFAPAQMAKRAKPPPEGLGMAEVMRRMDIVWADFIARTSEGSAPWLRIDRRQGFEAVREAYLETLHGSGHASAGLLLSL